MVHGERKESKHYTHIHTHTPLKLHGRVTGRCIKRCTINEVAEHGLGHCHSVPPEWIEDFEFIMRKRVSVEEEEGNDDKTLIYPPPSYPCLPTYHTHQKQEE